MTRAEELLASVKAEARARHEYFDKGRGLSGGYADDYLNAKAYRSGLMHHYARQLDAIAGVLQDMIEDSDIGSHEAIGYIGDVLRLPPPITPGHPNSEPR